MHLISAAESVSGWKKKILIVEVHTTIGTASVKGMERRGRGCGYPLECFKFSARKVIQWQIFGIYVPRMLYFQ